MLITFPFCLLASLVCRESTTLRCGWYQGTLLPSSRWILTKPGHEIDHGLSEPSISATSYHCEGRNHRRVGRGVGWGWSQAVWPRDPPHFASSRWSLHIGCMCVDRYGSVHWRWEGPACANWAWSRLLRWSAIWKVEELQVSDVVVPVTPSTATTDGLAAEPRGTACVLWALLAASPDLAHRQCKGEREE